MKPFCLRRLFLCLAAMLLFSGSARAESTEALVERTLSAMTLDEKLCQLFFVMPESFSRIAHVTQPTAKLKSALQKYPVGGLALFADHFVSVSQTRELTAAVQEYAREAHGIGLLIGTDEEGGGVSRAINKLKLTKVPSAGSLGETGDPANARAAGELIGTQLADLGLNWDFGPVADVRTDLDDTEIRSRSFGYDAALVADMTAAWVEGLTGTGLIATLKHFPGHGSSSGNSHDGRSISTRTVQQWRDCDWLPFQAGLKAGAEAVLMSHLTAAVVDNQSPASLSHRIVTELLRGELGFEGVVITDALRMDAVSAYYDTGDACVKAIQAGVDMLLLPKNFTNALNGLQAALADGTLTEARIDESVRRILALKAAHGLLQP